MASLNRATIIGNVGREPEMRFTPNGNPVVSFSVATNETYTDKDGGRHEKTEWFYVIAWNRLAETCNQFLVKGSQVYVEGRLQTRSWEGQDGQKKYRTEIVASRVLFLGKAQHGEGEMAETERADEPLPGDDPFEGG